MLYSDHNAATFLMVLMAITLDALHSRGVTLLSTIVVQIEIYASKRPDPASCMLLFSVVPQSDTVFYFGLWSSTTYLRTQKYKGVCQIPALIRLT